MIYIASTLALFMLTSSLTFASEPQEIPAADISPVTIDILILEDSLVTQQILQRKIQAASKIAHVQTSVNIANSGEQAMQIFTNLEGNVDLGIMDHNVLGEMTGYEVARQMRKKSIDNGKECPQMLFNSDDHEALEQLEQDRAAGDELFVASLGKKIQGLEEDLVQRLNALARKKSLESADETK